MKIYYLLFFILLSCSERKNYFEDDLTFFKNDGWTKITDYSYTVDTLGTYSIGEEINMVLKAEKSDTLITIEYLKNKNGVYEPNFYKIYPERQNSLVFFNKVAFLKNDTLYHYKVKSKKGIHSNFKKMFFISGKYYYLYFSGRLSPNQDRYFEKHKDSLIKIKGDTIPELPEF